MEKQSKIPMYKSMYINIKERIEKERLAQEAAKEARLKALEAEREKRQKEEEAQRKKEEERRVFLNGPKEKWAEKMKNWDKILTEKLNGKLKTKEEEIEFVKQFGVIQ